MRLIGLMPVRSEACCLGLSARVALMWCDSLVILDHASNDGTTDVLRGLTSEFPRRVTILTEDNPVWDEMPQRQRLLEAARLDGATHVAICDADEVLSANLGGMTYFHAAVKCPEGSILQLPGYNLRGGVTKYHASGIWGNRWFSLAFKDSPELGWSGDKFHSREPGGRKLAPYRPINQGDGGVMHLWGSSERRLVAKHRAYRIQERLRWPDKPAAQIEEMYSWATHGRPGFALDQPDTWAFKDVPESWWKPYEHLMHHLDINAVPWQEQWCDEMIQKHGIETFKGLSV